MKAENPIRTIKKYPNRRLYDTSTSTYITLEGVKQMVLEGETFIVIDSKTSEDITRSILIQIIGEQEAQDGSPMFSNTVLQHLIRFYGNSMQSLMSEYLERSIETFMEQQEAMQRQMQSVMEANPMSIMTQVAQQNLSMWQNFVQPVNNKKRS